MFTGVTALAAVTPAGDVERRDAASGAGRGHRKGSARTATVNGAEWSDFFGHFGSDPTYAAGFAAAASNVTAIGLSFGGGSFLENGIGTSDGSGTFTLESSAVS
jgi:hypothetical protein